MSLKMTFRLVLPKRAVELVGFQAFAAYVGLFGLLGFLVYFAGISIRNGWGVIAVLIGALAAVVIIATTIRVSIKRADNG